MRYELIMWINFFLKAIPGKIGCKIRNATLPYKNGRNVTVFEGVQIDKPSKLTLGHNVSINRGSIINAGGEIEIGNDVLIGPRVIIYSQNHRFDQLNIPIYKQGYVHKKTTIGNNVWIASGVIILPGVNIGDNVVVAAGSVVTKNIRSNYLVGGIPAKEIKTIP